MPETLEHCKTRALSLIDADKPIEAICAVCHCLRGLGLAFEAIGSKLEALHPIRDVDDVRQWVVELEA